MKEKMKKKALEKLVESLKGGESKMKATIIADSEEGLIEGAKKIPEVLSKSQEYMKKRMSEIDKPKKKKSK